ncbi:hypothetical protein [Pseudoduganella dura]|nr:hypothetical protein [Pseudoduganella dura]GGX76671.1 hypothetical protein GCM10007386_04710 [Pseudoduganella dura]
MNWTLQWKVVSLLGYIAALTAFLVMCGDGVLPLHTVILRLPSPL